MVFDNIEISCFLVFLSPLFDKHAQCDLTTGPRDQALATWSRRVHDVTEEGAGGRSACPFLGKRFLLHILLFFSSVPGKIGRHTTHGVVGRFPAISILLPFCCPIQVLLNCCLLNQIKLFAAIDLCFALLRTNEYIILMACFDMLSNTS